MGIATLNESAALRLHESAFVFDGHNDPAPYLFEGESLEDRALSGLRRLVAILDARPDSHVVRTADELQEASRAGGIVAVPTGPRESTSSMPISTKNSVVDSAGLEARGFDEPAPRAFLGSNRLRTLEAVLP